MKINHTTDREIIANSLLKERDYWTKQLANIYDVPKISSDFKKTEDKKYSRIDMQFNEELFKKIHSIANSSNYKLLILLSTGLLAFIRKHTNNEDVIFGIPIEKQKVGTEFINTILPIRLFFNKDFTFRELFAEAKKIVMDASSNQNYPVTKVLENHPNEYLRNILLLDNIHDKKYIDDIRPDIYFGFSYTDTGINSYLQYNKFAFKEETVNEILKQFLHLFNELILNVDVELSKLSFQSTEENNELLYNFNKTESAISRELTIIDLFEQQVKCTPENIAISENGISINYADLQKKVCVLAQLLNNKGVEKETVVALMGHRTTEMVIVILAVLKAGGTYLPINGQDPDERVKAILSDSKAEIMLVHSDVYSKKKLLFDESLNIKEIFLLEELFTDNKKNYSSDYEVNINSDNSAYIIYTSGSTGKPKGVIIEHKTLVNYSQWSAKTYVKNKKVSFPFYTSFSFDMTITSIFTPLITGNEIVLYNGEEKEFILEKVIEDNVVDIVKVTPSHLRMIANSCLNADDIEKYNNSKIKTLIVGGENFDSELLIKINELFNGKLEIYNEYGPTEATVGCMCYKYSKSDFITDSVPLGVPIDNAKIYILDKNKHPVPKGVIGEIYISGNCLAREYLHNKIATENSFLDNPFYPEYKMYKTGDLAKRLFDDSIVYLGRDDGQIKIRGYRVEIAEIEYQTKSLDSIDEAVVSVFGDQYEESYLGLFYISNRGIETTEVRTCLKELLPDYMIPTYINKLDVFPLTQNGKIDKSALKNNKDLNQDNIFIAQDELEKKLIKIWTEVLNMDKESIGENTSFFDVGGHSLSATAMVSRIHKELDYKISLVQLFKTPTIKSLSQYLKKLKKELFKPIKKIEKKEYYSTSPAQQRLFLAQQIDKNNVSANITGLYLLEGKLDVKKIEQTFFSILERHESLRTSFKIIDDELVQKVNNISDFEINIYKTNQNELKSFLSKLRKPFDLENHLLVNVNIVEFDTDKFILMVDLHHIVSDGVSMKVIVNEFMALYNNLSLPSLKIQYKDYCYWKNIIFNKHIKKQEEYWLNEFSGDFNYMKLPHDYQIGSNTELDFSTECNSLKFNISQSCLEKIKYFVQSNESSLFIVLLSFYYIFLNKISFLQDLTVRTITAGRSHSYVESTVGLFVNPVAIRVDFQSNDSFMNFHTRIKDKVFDAYEHDDYQFENLVEKVTKSNEQRNLSPVGFTLDNTELPDFSIPGLKMEPFNFDEATLKGDLYLTARESDKGLRLIFDYSPKLFRSETIEMFSEIFNDIIEQCSNNWNISLDELEIRKDEEIQSSFDDDGDFICA